MLRKQNCSEIVFILRLIIHIKNLKLKYRKTKANSKTINVGVRLWFQVK